MNEGLFITFEGGEGSGKTTQIALLKKYLDDKGLDSYLTREPGGLDISEEIREVLLKTRHENTPKMSPYCELFLYVAARAHFFEHIVIPNLNLGKVVISDRSFDSTMAYQGYARGIDIEHIDYMNMIATKSIKPKITFYLDVDPVIGLERARGRSLLNRLDAEPLDFHNKVREGYNKIAEKECERFIKIDAHKDVDAIHKNIIRELKKKIKIS